ncbi:MFS general substrate transporter [Serendipita vermifera]|nr:MFS general substrate transporter [Serendipita vermifera]
MLSRHLFKKTKERDAEKVDEKAAPENQAGNPDDSNTVTNPENQDATPPPKQSKWQVWKPRVILISAIFLPVFLETLDYTVVATSQTNIASKFNRLDLQSYIGTAYVLGSTVFLPIFASLADVFGRYWAMQVSVVIFMVGSAFSTGANSMALLLVGRGIAGVGAAGLLAIVRIILSDSESLDDNNSLAGLMFITYSVGYTLGPFLGGLLLHVNWRWVFGINLPVCAASIVIMALLLPKISKGPQPPQRLSRLHLPPSELAAIQAKYPPSFTTSLQRIDSIGAVIFIIMGAAILLGLNWGSTDPKGWNQPKVIATLVLGGALLPVFVLWEYIVDHSTDHLVQPPHNDTESALPEKEKGKGVDVNQPMASGIRGRIARLAPEFARITDPIVPMNMFRSYDVIATNYATLTSGMVMLGIFYFVAIFFVIVSGKDAVKSGVQLLYFAPGIGVGVLISMILLKRTRQPRSTIVFASLVLPLAVGLLSQALYEDKELQIMGFMIMAGGGVGLGFGPLSIQARFRQPEDRVAIVVATNLFFRTAGGIIGIAQLSAVMFSRVRSYITAQVYKGRISPFDALRIASSLNSVGSRPHGPGGGRNNEGNGTGIFDLPENLKNVTIEAFKDGLRWAFLSLVPWLAVAFVMSLFLNKIDEERFKGTGDKDQRVLPPVEEKTEPTPTNNPSEQATKREEEKVV